MTQEPVGGPIGEVMPSPGMILDKLIVSDDPFDRAWAQRVAQIIDIRLRKRNDYTGSDPDQLSNYRASGYAAAKALGVTATPTQAALVSMITRVQEKVNRVVTLLSGVERRVQDETLIETYDDIANIAMLSGAELVVTEDD